MNVFCRSQLNLDVLVNKGLVEKGTINRRTNSYQITNRGEEKLRKRREWENEKVERELEEALTV